MGDDIEVSKHRRIGRITIRLKICDDRARQSRPLRLGDRSRRPSMISRVHPSVPEGQRDVQPSKLRFRSRWKLMLDCVETPADGVVFSPFVRNCVLKQMRDKRIPRFGVIHRHADKTMSLQGGALNEEVSAP
jgi:hypothetical protein